MGRPLQFDKNLALEKAIETFWSKGYTATSLGDLLRSMNLSKSSFYQSFISKQHLFEMGICHYRKVITDQMREGLAEAASGRAYIEANLETIATAAASGRRNGCLLMNTISEFAQQDPDIAALVRQGIEQIESIFLKAVRQGQSDGTISGRKNAESLARYLVSSRSGLNIMAKAGATPTELRTVIGTVLSALD